MASGSSGGRVAVRRAQQDIHPFRNPGVDHPAGDSRPRRRRRRHQGIARQIAPDDTGCSQKVTALAAPRDRGIAIVAALWASAILAVIVVSVLQLVRGDAKLGRGRADVAELGAIADAAVNITVLALLNPKPAQWPVNGAPVNVPFA